MIKQLFSNKHWLCAILVTFLISTPNVWGTDLCNFTTFNGWPSSGYSDTKTYTPSTGVTWTFTGVYRQNTSQATLQIQKNTSNCVITTPSFGSNVGTITITFSAGAGTVYIKDASNNSLGNSSFSSSSPASIDVSSSSVSQVKICVTENNTATAYITALQITTAGGGGSSGDFVLVESTPSDWEGEYLIVYNNTNAMNTHNGNANANTYATYTNISSYYTSSTKTIASNNTTEGLVYVVAASTNGYTIKRKAATEYLGYNDNSSRTGAYLRWDGTITANQNEWTLGVGSIVSVHDNTRAIRWNNNSGSYRFAIYVTNGQQAIQLFKRNAGSSCSRPTSVGTKNGSSK